MESSASQPASAITQAGNSLLETLPVEIFRKITDYLAFFDEKALQTTSKKCHLLVGPLTCTDKILWIVHSYRSGLRSPSDSTAMWDIDEFNSLTTRCLTSDSWIDLSQGQETRDAHQAFLNDWDSIDLHEIPDDFHPRGDHLSLMMELRTSQYSSRLYSALDVNLRYKMVQRMYALPQ